jgi:hypothetical protein
MKDQKLVCSNIQGSMKVLFFIQNSITLSYDKNNRPSLLPLYDSTVNLIPEMYIKTSLILLHLHKTSTLLAIQLQKSGKKDQVYTDNSKCINNVHFLGFLRDDPTENNPSYCTFLKYNHTSLFGQCMTTIMC